MKRIAHFHTHRVPAPAIHYLRGCRVDGLLRGPNLNSKLRVGYQFDYEQTSECLGISCARKAGKIPRTIKGRTIRVAYTVARAGSIMATCVLTL